MRIIGIDPGLRTMGWGIVEPMGGSRLVFIASGICKSGEGSLADRLLRLHDGLADVIEQFAPDEAAVEETFVNKDARATLKLGQARGVAMLVPAKAGLPVSEYAPNTVKKTVVGVGHAEKRQVIHMIRLQLPAAAPQTHDEADALAIAICHAHHRASHSQLTDALRKAAG
ncbi:crossover junction endodeoxyribonuclease RuvC [Aestuariibius insulae]|uniref:crossover junction endodeoxyribonuclease RuvC n=1 Tax=Aestuariibius insulae TaxID=2058287 RepID=UPI00345E39DF